MGLFGRKKDKKNTAAEAQPQAATEPAPTETAAPAPAPTEKGSDMFR